MITLHELKADNRKKKKVVGRGPSSGHGKTSARGENGAKSRRGYTRRYGYEGGQFRLFMKLPIRGFSRARFQKKAAYLNLKDINIYFQDGETVSVSAMKEKKLLPMTFRGKLKILSKGNVEKKVKIHADLYSKAAEEKLKKEKIEYKVNK